MKKTKNSDTIEKIKFEEGLKQLEDIINKLEKGEMGLDESIHCFQEGSELFKALHKRLSDAEGEVKSVLVEFEDNIITKDLE